MPKLLCACKACYQLHSAACTTLLPCLDLVPFVTVLISLTTSAFGSASVEHIGSAANGRCNRATHVQTQEDYSLSFRLLGLGTAPFLVTEDKTLRGPDH